MEQSFPKRPFRTHGGAHVPHHKNTAHTETHVMPPPDEITLPMTQHIGAPCVPCVKKGDHVYVGTKVADSDAYVSVPIHSSVSGTVKEIKKVIMPGGQAVDAVIITSDGLMEHDPAVCPPPEIKTKQQLADAARASGLVGLGKNVLAGIYKIKEILDVHRVIIAIEDNKPDAIEALTRIADDPKMDPNDEVRVLKLHASYPQGAEKVLVQAATGRKVPAGGLPADVGCLVMNIGSVSFLASYMRTGMPLTMKRVTVDGSAVQNPQNVIVPIGTKIREVMEFCGGYKEEPQKLIMGGPMMGVAVTTDELPVLKQNNGLLAFGAEEARLLEPTDCIRCGRCVAACPMNLVPAKLEKYAERKDVEMLKKLDIMTCMECGCCAFSCPAKRRIVQAIRLGKYYVKKEAAKK